MLTGPNSIVLPLRLVSFLFLDPLNPRFRVMFWTADPSVTKLRSAFNFNVGIPW
jgi:hypothetical protein